MNAAKKKSKKQSDAGYGKKQPDSITFFLDRALGKHKVANYILGSIEYYPDIIILVERSDDHFLPTAPDVELLKFVGQKGWVFLTKDKQIRYRKAEFEMVQKYDVPMFTLTSGNLTAEQMGEIFVKSIPRMIKFIKRTPAPFIATISKSGKITKVS